jgi:FkbM family methyltransferase
MIQVFGDSHSQFIFQNTPGIQVNWLGPITMHRVGRDGLWFLKDHEFRTEDWLLTVFGEIDARCHVGKIADQRNRPYAEIVADLVRRYINSLNGTTVRKIIAGVPPPADGPGIINADFPVYGTIEQRINITRLINDELIAQASTVGIPVLEIPSLFEDAAGGLDSRLSDGSVHINRSYVWPIIKSLEAIVGARLLSPVVSEYIAVTGPASTEMSSSKELPHGVFRLFEDFRRKLAALHPLSPSRHTVGATPFRIDSLMLQNNSRSIGGYPPTIEGPAEKWSYAAMLPNSLSPMDATKLGPVAVIIQIKLLSGGLAIGLVGHDLKSFISQAIISRPNEVSPVRLHAPNLADISAIVFRSADSNAKLIFSVLDLRVERTTRQAERATARGFYAKSAVADISRLSNAPIRTIFDVGANVGEMTALFTSSFSEASVHAFEPNPTAAMELAQRFASKPQIYVNNCALGATSSRRELYTYSNSAISSLLPIETESPSFMDGPVELTEKVSVTVETIDRYMQEHNVNSVDVLKIDTQGFERSVLEGARAALNRRQIGFILTELLFVPLYESQTSYPDLLIYLWNFGYELIDFYDFVYDANGQLKWGDGLFRPR